MAPDWGRSAEGRQKTRWKNLPLVLEDLKLAFNRCLTLNQTIHRISFLARIGLGWQQAG
jgi:hypothetical protein